jgi:ProP effector
MFARKISRLRASVAYVAYVARDERGNIVIKTTNIKAVYATIDLLAAAWPQCFSGPVSGRRPLKVGIGKEIAAATEGAITPEELNVALQHYVGAKAYQRQLREGAQRVDLDGSPAGTVTAEQAARARRHIERLEARHSARVRAKGLAMEAAARKAKAEAEQVQREAEEAKRAEEIAAGKRKPMLRLPRQRAAVAAQQSA